MSSTKPTSGPRPESNEASRVLEPASSHSAPSPFTSSSPSAALTKFTLFPKLPTELLIRVRNIYMGTQNSLYADLSTWNPYALYSSTNVPPLLHTCHESRVEGLKYCDLDFGSTFKFENSGTDKKFPNMEITLPP
ncbi:hypothetical protein IFR04_015171 [Cadophora malorum]|uniref:2EXR domain-containing protein n=1 Tax=Cadophora malorum TaxID=108018 RepID=A0A8H7T3S2_9HELO|nr:hypothetical protein IFR04_015171 [Cadophora malorum]